MNAKFALSPIKGIVQNLDMRAIVFHVVYILKPLFFFLIKRKKYSIIDHCSAGSMTSPRDGGGRLGIILKAGWGPNSADHC